MRIFYPCRSGQADRKGENMEEEKKVLKEESTKDVTGGARSYKGGYCPYTEDRNCRLEQVGSFDPKNEICVECGWRAW